MSDPTFHEVLKEKFNLQDELKCEGEFVRLYGTDKQAGDLVTVGFSEKALIVAKLNLSSDKKDFDLQTLTPLPLVRVAVQNYEDKIISIRSQYKPIQIYQLCSSEHQEDVWSSFVKFVDNIYRQEILEAAVDRARIVLKQKKDFFTRAVVTPTTPVSQSQHDRNNSCNPAFAPSRKENQTTNTCPKEFVEFNKKFSMRTFDNLDWFPNFSFTTPRTPKGITRNIDLWTNLVDDIDDKALDDDEEEVKDEKNGLWTKVKNTARKATCCFPWLRI